MMEPPNRRSEERGFMLTDGIVSPDALASTGKVFSAWDFRTSSTESSVLGQTHELINGLGKQKSWFPDGSVKSVPSCSSGEYLTWKSDYGSVVSSSFSSIVVDSKTFSSRDGSAISAADSSTTGWNLGRLADYRDSRSNISFTCVLPSISSSVRSKRARGMNLNSHIPLCQVFGCNMDLSSSKDYHKRHKVCELHSKTAKVIVNGLEQRFCQQCSRFHLLAEFDDGKRSCRKRLAGHNQRRRKPHIEQKSGRKFLETTLATQTAFLCPDILSAGIVREVKYENINEEYPRVKVEDEPIYSYHPSPLVLNQYGADKQLSSRYASSSIFGENSERYSDDLASVSPIPRTLLSKTLSENGVFVAHGLSSVSGCALSLLSTQPHNSSITSSGVPTGIPMFMQNGPGSAQNNVNLLSETLAMSLQGSTSVASNRFSSSRRNSVDDDHLGSLLTSDASNTNLGAQADGIVNSSDYMREKDEIFHHQGATGASLQLCSQLHRYDQQSRSKQVKMANEEFMSCMGL